MQCSAAQRMFATTVLGERRQRGRGCRRVSWIECCVELEGGRHWLAGGGGAVMAMMGERMPGREREREETPSGRPLTPSPRDGGRRYLATEPA